MTTAQRILIVDDEDAILFAMRDYFRVGDEVDAAHDAAEAAACIDVCPYAVVIADLCLSELQSAEGLEVARYVRQQRPDTAVVLFTANGSAEVEAEAKRQGALVVLKKPQPLADIERLVSELAANLREAGAS